MSLVVFSQRNVAAQRWQVKELKERLFCLGGAECRIQQRWQDDGRGGTETGFGACVYDAYLIIADPVAACATGLAVPETQGTEQKLTPCSQPFA